MLKQIQNQFKNALFDTQMSDIAFIRSQNSILRFNVYRQTVFENLRHALEITYPGIWCLLGSGCANNVARLYITNETNSPKSGCLDDWGETFGSFLETIPSLQPYIYLKDYAHLEW